MEARGHEAIDSSDRGNVSQPFSTLSFFQGHVNQDISARKEKTAVHRYIVREHHTQVLHPNKMEERKLKPIYGKFHLIRHSFIALIWPLVADELERGRAKNALGEIEKYQKRYPKQANSPIIGALKCVALQRQRNDDGAYQSFLDMVRANSKGGKAKSDGKDTDEEIPDDVVIDESTLHTLGYALRPMRKSEFKRAETQRGV
jgi:hypothetical protein